MKNKHKLFLRIRSYESKKYVSVWLLDGPAGGAVGCLMHGMMMPKRAEELVAMLGLRVEREDMPYKVTKSDREKSQEMTKKGLF